MSLISEKLAKQAIVEAVMAIEEMSRLANQAQVLYDRQQSNTLNESARRILVEDLNKAMKDLQTSSQASMGKIDQAIKFVDMFIQVCSNASQAQDDVWGLLQASFNEAKTLVADLASLNLGTIDSVKSMFKDGGKYAAVMDNLASEMSIMSVFIKILSAGFAQAIRIMETMPAEYKKDPNNKKGSVTLADFVNNDPSGQLDAAELEKGVKTMMSDIQQKNGGYAFSMKGIKNFFKKNSGSMGMAALAGGLAFFTGGIALPGILGALALGSAAKKKLTREPDDAMGAYKTSINDVAAAMMRTQISAIEAGVPLFVKAVKGASVEEFAEAAAEAQKTVQSITSGIDTDDLLTKYIEEYGANAEALSNLYDLDPDKTSILLQNFMNTPNSLKGTAVYDDFVNLKEKYLSESYDLDDDEMLLEDSDLVHEFGLGDLLFEDGLDEKRRRRKKRKKPKKKKPTSKKRKSSKSTKSTKSSKNKKGAQNKKQDKGDDKATARKKYTKAKATIKSYGRKQLSGAEKKPSTKNIRVKAVDKKEDQLNRGLKDVNRKRQITKIADDFEAKIKAIDAEEAGTAPDTTDVPDTPDVDTGAADTGSENEESGTGGKVAAAGAAGAGAAAASSGDDADADAPSQELVDVADKVDAQLPDATPTSTRDDLRNNLYGKENAPSIPEIETSIEKDTEKDVNITSMIDRATSGAPIKTDDTSADASEEKPSEGAIDFSNADIAALSKMPALADIFGAKKRTETQDKYLKTLMGEAYFENNVDDILVEKYDRRLMHLAGIK